MKQDTKHTPGPWFVYEPEWNDPPTTGRCDNILIGKKHRNDIPQEIARVNCDSSFFPSEPPLEKVKSSLVKDVVAPAEAIANARLIAASPRQNEVLKKLLHEAMRFDWEDHCAFQLAVEEAEDVLVAADPDYERLYETAEEICSRERERIAMQKDPEL